MAQVTYSYFEEGSPDKVVKHHPKKRKVDKSEGSGDEYNAPSRNPSEEPMSSSSIVEEDMDLQVPMVSNETLKISNLPVTPAVAPVVPDAKKKAVVGQAGMSYCGLCNKVHTTGNCPMTQEVGNLLEYRKMLVDNEDEPFDTRVRLCLFTPNNVLTALY